MPGSSCSIACPNMIMNTIVAEALSSFSEVLEQADDFQKALNKLIHDTLIRHSRIIYGGNNYSEEWRQEAQRRGLSNFTNTVEVLPHYTDEKNVRLFEKHGVLSAAEIASRQEVLLENYSKSLAVEALTFANLTRKDILPAVLRYQKFLLKELQLKDSVCPLPTTVERELLQQAANLCEKLYAQLISLEETTEQSKAIKDTLPAAEFARAQLFTKMEELRETVDTLETLLPRKMWPFPTYAEILYSVK